MEYLWQSQNIISNVPANKKIRENLKQIYTVYGIRPTDYEPDIQKITTYRINKHRILNFKIDIFNY